MVRCRVCGDVFCCKAHRETHESRTHPSSLHLLKNLPGVCLRCGISVYYLNQLKCKCIKRMDKHKVVRKDLNVRPKLNVSGAYLRFSSNSTNFRKRKELIEIKRVDGTTDSGSRKIIAASRKRNVKDLNFGRSNSAPTQTIQFMKHLKEMVSPEIQNALKSSTPISESDGEKKKDFERAPVVLPFDKSLYGTPSDDKLSFSQNFDAPKTKTDLRCAFEENDKLGGGRSTPIRSILSSTFKRSYSEHALACNSFTYCSGTPLRNLRPSSAKKSVKFSDFFEFKENMTPKTSPNNQDLMEDKDVSCHAASEESENKNIPESVKFSAVLVTTSEQNDGILSSRSSVVQTSASEFSFGEKNTPISQRGTSESEVLYTSVELIPKSPPFNNEGNVSNRKVLSEISQRKLNNSINNVWSEEGQFESHSEPTKCFTKIFDSGSVSDYALVVEQSFQDTSEGEDGLALIKKSLQESCDKKGGVSSTLVLTNESLQESCDVKYGVCSTLVLINESFQESCEREDSVPNQGQINESSQELCGRNNSLFDLAAINEIECSDQLSASVSKYSIVTQKSGRGTTENIVEKITVESRGLFSNQIFIGSRCDKKMYHSCNVKNMNHSRFIKCVTCSGDIIDTNRSENTIASITSHSISMERDEILYNFAGSDEIKSSFATKITKSLGYLFFGIQSTIISAFGWKKKNEEKKKSLKRPSNSSRESTFGSKILVLSKDSDSPTEVGASRNRVRRILRRNPINPSEFGYGSRLSALLLARSPLPHYVKRYSEFSGEGPSQSR